MAPILVQNDKCVEQHQESVNQSQQDQPGAIRHNMSQKNLRSFCIFFIVCCLVCLNVGSPIDDGSYMDDDTRISRRHDFMQGFVEKEDMFKKSEPKVRSSGAEIPPKQARSTDSQVDPSFVLSKFLYHMAQLPSV